MTVGGKDVPNPLPGTEENIAEGREHFGHHCGICHGLDGQSTGVPFADRMSPPCPEPHLEGRARLRGRTAVMDHG
jgi:mono/diheme cytochrome c family protein